MIFYAPKKSVCNKFNYGVCSDEACEYDHICISKPDRPLRIINCTEVEIQYHSDNLENDMEFGETDRFILNETNVFDFFKTTIFLRIPAIISACHAEERGSTPRGRVFFVD